MSIEQTLTGPAPGHAARGASARGRRGRTAVGQLKGFSTTWPPPGRTDPTDTYALPRRSATPYGANGPLATVWVDPPAPSGATLTSDPIGPFRKPLSAICTAHR